MSAPVNYDDVLQQLHAAGLIVEHLEIGRLVRCYVEGGDREKRGWYSLHEIQGDKGDVFLVGSFGVWRGAENNAQKIALKKADQLTPDQLAAIRRRIQEDQRRARAHREALAKRAAQIATRGWAKLSPTGDCDYLARKGVQAHGLRFSPSGAAAIAMLDANGVVHGLQIIRSAKQTKGARGKLSKEYWPRHCETKGHFFLIGIPQTIVLIAEGYATAASLHEATGLPTAIAFDANNLIHVAAALHKRYPRAKVLVCADDDYLATCAECQQRTLVATKLCFSCGKEHRGKNAGVAAASTAALEVEGAWVAPLFDPDVRRQALDVRGDKLTDFNDLHLAQGLQEVRQQIETRVAELGWNLVGRMRAPNSDVDGSGGGADAPLKPIADQQEMLERFALVYGQSGTVFDHQEHVLLALSDMRDACLSRQMHRAWMEHPERQLVRVKEVGFDPAGEDPQITCNLWAGWPTQPKKGECKKLLELLEYMCSDDPNAGELYQWVLRWIAYPIKNPGAKMKTSLVVHGPQGTGKNMFFEALMQIYGPYGRVIDQSAIEDKFNDWASRKLFLIADEVVARSDVYHVKNRLKAFITGDWIRINPKNIAAYDERNHVNVAFLSNESMPVVLEEDDRRYAVIWTPVKLGQDFYAEVREEIKAGGIQALHDYLLNLDLGPFNDATLPPRSAAKIDLINQSLDSTSRFFYELSNQQISGVEPIPALSQDVYWLYRHWCGQNGLRAAPMPRLVDVFRRKHGVPQVRKRYAVNGPMGTEVKGPHAIMLLGKDHEPPPGLEETAWLGQHVFPFRTAVNDLRGMNQ